MPKQHSLYEPLQDRVIRVIKPLIPHDAEDRVDRAVKLTNSGVRQIIRDESGLRLSGGDLRQTIPVRVIEGFPTELAHLIDRYSDPVLWRLIMAQPKLGAVIEGLQYLLNGWDAFEKWDRLPVVARGGGPSLQRAVDIAISLQQATIADQVRKEIKQVTEDILGAYFYTERQPYIELYWMPIAMFAAILNVHIEDLAVVVLAHELTHGYTHIGYDIDGVQWNTHEFGRCDRRVTEGLAQFYAEVVASRLTIRMPGLKRAFDELFNIQGGPYIVHRSWLNDDTHQRGEIVRFAMIAARNQKESTYDEWMQLLNRATKDLSERSRINDRQNNE